MKYGIYILFLILTFVACEEVYNPKIDEVDNMLVVEAVLRVDQQVNTVRCDPDGIDHEDRRGDKHPCHFDHGELLLISVLHWLVEIYSQDPEGSAAEFG